MQLVEEALRMPPEEDGGAATWVGIILLLGEEVEAEPNPGCLDGLLDVELGGPD